MSERAKGITFWESGGSEKHVVVLGVSSKRFFEHYFSVFQ